MLWDLHHRPSIQTNAKLLHNCCYDSLCFFSFNAPEKLQNHKIHIDVISISYACFSCAPEKAPEFGAFSTLATSLVDPLKKRQKQAPAQLEEDATPKS